MSLYKHCNNPGCDTYQKISDWSLAASDGWVKLDQPDLDFCSWRCVHEFAEKKIPAGLVFER